MRKLLHVEHRRGSKTLPGHKVNLQHADRVLINTFIDTQPRQIPVGVSGNGAYCGLLVYPKNGYLRGNMMTNYGILRYPHLPKVMSAAPLPPHLQIEDIASYTHSPRSQGPKVLPSYRQLCVHRSDHAVQLLTNVWKESPLRMQFLPQKCSAQGCIDPI